MTKQNSDMLKKRIIVVSLFVLSIGILAYSPTPCYAQEVIMESSKNTRKIISEELAKSDHLGLTPYNKSLFHFSSNLSNYCGRSIVATYAIAYLFSLNASPVVVFGLAVAYSLVKKIFPLA